MALKHILSALALVMIAGCQMQTTDVSRQSGETAAWDRHAPSMAVAVTAGNIAQFASASSDSYLVGRGDVLQIHAIDASELTTPTGYLVEADGAIQVPFLGRIPAAERAAPDIRADIANRLRKYLPNPQVELRIIEHNARHISVIGDVARPNRQALTSNPLTVIDAINAAGGFAPRANMRGVSILRNGQAIAVDMDSFLQRGSALPVLRDGDVVQVGGAALRGSAPATPQGVRIQLPGQSVQTWGLGGQDVSVLQVLHSANAVGAAAQIARSSPLGVTAYQLAADDAANPSVGGRFLLRDGDEVLVYMQP